MHSKKRAVFPLLILAFFLVVSPAIAAPIAETGSLSAEIDRLKALVFPKNSMLYVQPTVQNRDDYRALTTSVMDGDYDTASTQATALGYELVRYHDTDTSRNFYLLREALNEYGEQNLGWGNYIWNPTQGKDILIEAPHPLYDTNTPEFAIEVFQGVHGRGYLMAGAHRASMGDGTMGQANVCGHTDSIFHVVHETWSLSTTLPIQIHGFDWDKHTNFPAGTDVVLSNGDGAVPQPHIDLDDSFDDTGLLSFCYNSLPVNDPTNILVNTDWENGGVVYGGTFGSLGGGYNVQGQYTRNTYGAPWIHCELEQSIRFNDPALWDPAVEAIVSTYIPEPSTLLLLAPALLGFAGLLRRRLR